MESTDETDSLRGVHVFIGRLQRPRKEFAR